jgi:decaprenylphospho-beta-D-ribofuranose 2-oxidase
MLLLMTEVEAVSKVARDAHPSGPAMTTAPWPDAPRQVFRGWGRNTASHATAVSPSDVDAWRALLSAAGPRGVIARGAGSGYGDCAQNAGGYIASTRLSAGVSIDDATASVSVGAGVLLADLMPDLAARGWTLPVLPGTAHVTVGGAIAADVHGKNHPSVGSFGSHVVEIDLLTASLGAMTVGPTVGSEVFWATVGGLGLTGVILRARIRLQRIETAWMWCRDSVRDDLDGILTELRAAHARGSFAAAWLDGHATAGHLGRGIVSECWPAIVGDLPARVPPLKYPTRRPVPIPSLGGRGVVRRPAVRAVNVAHVSKARRATGRRLRPISAALHPLDVTRGWAGLYGRAGVVQYQFAVPFGHDSVLSWVLAESAREGCPASLVVLKQFGERNAAPMSFPTPGWTLAMDFPAGATGLGALLDAADDAVVAAGGRVYLVKDSRLRPDLVAAMYPDLDAWRGVCARLDPDGRVVSDLSRRLRLTGREAA